MVAEATAELETIRAGRPLRRGREPGEVPLSLAGRLALPLRPRAARRRRRARLQPERGPRDEHRAAGRLQPRLEARDGLPRRGGRGAARHLRVRAPSGRRAGRRLGRRRRGCARAHGPRRAGRARRRDPRGDGRPRDAPTTRPRPHRRSIAPIRAPERWSATAGGIRRRACCCPTHRRSSRPAAIPRRCMSSPTAAATRCWCWAAPGAEARAIGELVAELAARPHPAVDAVIGLSASSDGASASGGSTRRSPPARGSSRSRSRSARTATSGCARTAATPARSAHYLDGARRLSRPRRGVRARGSGASGTGR